VWESCNEADDVCVLLPAIFSEDFEGSVPGWTIINNNQNNAEWSYDNPKNRDNYAGTGEFAIADSDNYQNKDMDTELRTPLLNLSSLITVFLEFKTDLYIYDNIFSGNEIADVDVSTNGISGPWTNVWRKTSDYFEATEVIEITTLAAGHADVMIRFHYYDAYNDWWWQIDDVKIRGFCMDSDSDGTDDCNDSCPSDPEKIEPGVCGCSVSDTDSDNDGVADCNDICPGFDDSADADADGVPDGCDNCPSDPDKTEPGICGCGVSDADSDGDGTLDCHDTCSSDPDKTEPGICGCGVSDADSDGDGTADCNDICPGFDDTIDTDVDGVPDGCDDCPGFDDTIDTDIDGVPDGCDDCPIDPEKIEPGVCGCGIADPDTGDILDLVTRYYQDILGRDPEPEGLEYWAYEISRIVCLGIDIKEGFIALGKEFFNSVEYIDMDKTDEQYLADLYWTFLGRGPDAEGETFWLDQLAGGLTRNMVLNNFVFSPEFRDYMVEIFGDSGVRPEYNLVNDQYRGILSTLPDDGGYIFWLANMQEAQCTGEAAVRDLTSQIALLFITSPGYTAKGRSNSEFLEDIYDAIQKRAPDLSGHLFWLGLLNSGALSREEVLQEFVNSVEFQGRVQEVIDAGCIVP
jgi:hypothetical protein